MAKTITETADQQATGLERGKRGSGDNGGSKAIALEGFKSQPERLRSFLTDVRSEMRKVVWPSREEVKSTTGVVIGCVFVFAGYFFLVDYVVGQGITQLIKHFTAH